jgi:flagellum-specific ATP synthase
MAAGPGRSARPVLNRCLPLLDELGEAQLRLDPVRYGLVSACDGGLLEVSGLNAPVGALCEVSHGTAPLTAEVIGFRNGRSLLMLLGDTVLLRPGARVRTMGTPGMVPVGDAYLGRAVDGAGQPIDGGPPLHARALWPVGGKRTGALDRSPVRQPFDTGVRPLSGSASGSGSWPVRAWANRCCST